MMLVQIFVLHSVRQCDTIVTIINNSNSNKDWVKAQVGEVSNVILESY